jgi:limonene-1,2-epoxide hydrolase
MGADAFRKAVEARALEAAVDCLADDVALHSPVLFRAFEGRDAVRAVLSAALNTLEDFRYTDVLDEGETAVLVFRARVDDKEVEGIDLLRFDEQGKIADFTVLMRPLSGLTAFSGRMAADPGLAEAVKAR